MLNLIQQCLEVGLDVYLLARHSDWAAPNLTDKQIISICRNYVRWLYIVLRNT